MAWTGRQRKGSSPAPLPELPPGTRQLRTTDLHHTENCYVAEEVVNGGSTSGPCRNAEGNVTLGEEQKDAVGHGPERKTIRPTIAEAADGVQRSGD